MSEILPQDNSPRKQCSKCPNSYPATTEFFSKDKRSKDGLQRSCKVCYKQYYQEHKDTIKKSSRKRYQEHGEEVRAYQKHYGEVCKEQISARNKRYREENKQEMSERRKLLHEQNREHILARRRQYYATHKDRISELYKNGYRKTEQCRVMRRASWHKREAIKKAIPGNYTQQQVQDQLKRQKCKCYYAACGHAKFEKVNGEYVYHIEHTIPLSRTEEQPRNDIDSIVLACALCNLKKGTKLPHEFFEGGRLL